jgi:hypothetical protein
MVMHDSGHTKPNASAPHPPSVTPQGLVASAALPASAMDLHYRAAYEAHIAAGGSAVLPNLVHGSAGLGTPGLPMAMPGYHGGVVQAPWGYF